MIETTTENNYKHVVILDTSILNFLCHRNHELDKSPRVQKIVKDLTGQEIRTDSTYISGFALLEAIGIKPKAIIQKIVELTTPINNNGQKIADIFKSELDMTIEILNKEPALSILAIQKQYSEHIKYQSSNGKHWYKYFIGHHLKDFSQKHKNLIRQLAIETTIGRTFKGFNSKELSLQFAVLYITGLVHDDFALASPRTLEKIIAPLAENDPNKVLSDVGHLSTKDFHAAQKYREKEELVDIEITQHLIFGYDNTHGLRSVIVFTCEDPDTIEARVNAATGFLVYSRDVHKKDFNPGIVYGLDPTTLKVLKKFIIKDFIDIHKQNDGGEAPKS